ncbi:carbohydrate ABC transporter permease [Microbacterium rhizosphaerae]|uniref:Sugar ABC transporter permease n=1 Tax=Microbacterium rhizosphaerae TaxID=1678237 RepID=A0ABZ0SIY5_9MICO|nr:sugar ABC transporter permease [Microbacterium rhizosphaerae]WPR89337.1 sugar ABC transporter permease [Microbacterium rhizosphaerae]
MTLMKGSVLDETKTRSEPKSRPQRRSEPRYERRDRMAAAPFFLAALLVVGIVLLIPFVYTIIRSFIGSGDEGFVGFANYVTMFEDPNLQLSLFNTVFWAIGSLIIPVVLGLGIAVMTSSMRLGGVARAAVILPYALAGTVVAIIGNIIFTSAGSLNQALEFIGLLAPGAPVQWLLHWPLNVISALLIASWQSTGVNVVLYMVGLQTIPRETVEAAAIDGADGWVRFKDVILPQLRPTTIVVIGLTITNALRAFDVIWVLTQGGPNRTSETLALSMYRESFLLLDPAVGSAIAVVLTIIVVVCSWIYLRRQIGNEA